MTTIEAIEASITHWKHNLEVGYVGADLSRHPCALCHKFFDAYCGECPVCKATGQANCYGSPYDKASKARDSADAAGFNIAAKEEIAFLEMLLEKEKAK